MNEVPAVETVVENKKTSNKKAKGNKMTQKANKSVKKTKTPKTANEQSNKPITWTPQRVYAVNMLRKLQATKPQDAVTAEELSKACKRKESADFFKNHLYKDGAICVQGYIGITHREETGTLLCYYLTAKGAKVKLPE